MEVVQLLTIEGKVRYYLADDNGLPIEPVLRFLRFKDNTNHARNTLKRYCYHLKLYFEYLEQRGVDFKEVTLDDLSSFVGWLQNHHGNMKVIPFSYVEPKRKPQTVNLIVDAVLIFYDYLLRHEEYENCISERLAKFIHNPRKNFREFLYGIARSKDIKSHVLRLRVQKRNTKTLSREQTQMLVTACVNTRDKFLLLMLYETGMRIGEILSLWIEDFDPSGLYIDLKDRGELENQAEIKTVSSPRRIDISQRLINLFMEYICRYHTEEVDTNHVFIKLSGSRRWQAMGYSDVDNVFRKLRKRTEIYVTPHMFRHTSLSLLQLAGWEPEHLRIRAGHKNIYTTLNTYVHPTDEEISSAFRKTEGSFIENNFYGEEPL